MKKIIISYALSMYTLLTSMVYAQGNMPDNKERIYSLSVIWKEMQYNFAFQDKLQQSNLDSLYIAYLPKIEQVKNNYEYYRTLCAFMAHFNEAHTRISVANRPDDFPPLKTINFGEKIIVSNVVKSMTDEIPLGSEILKINNIPVVKYLNDSVFQYIAAATSHWKFDKAVTEMLHGEPHSSVNITIKTLKGQERDVKMFRDYNSNYKNEVWADTTQTPPIYIEILNGSIGYIRITSFSGLYVDTINFVFNQHLPQLRNCEGLIIDIRGNRGGTDEAWENLACHFIAEQQFDTKGKWFSKKHISTYKFWGQYDSRFKDYYLGVALEEIIHPRYINNVNNSLKLHQPLIIISGQYVGSAAETFLITLKENERALIIGEPSVGCVGEPMFVSLPGNYRAMICAKKYVNPDGSQPNDTGVLPDIEVKRDYFAYLKGQDNILDFAVTELLKQIKKQED